MIVDDGNRRIWLGFLHRTAMVFHGDLCTYDSRLILIVFVLVAFFDACCEPSISFLDGQDVRRVFAWQCEGLSGEFIVHLVVLCFVSSEQLCVLVLDPFLLQVFTGSW